MPEQLTQQEIQLRDKCDHFATEIMLTQNPDEPDQARDNIRNAAKEAGLFAMTQPEQFGGTAASQLQLTIARETLAAHNPPFLDAVFGPSPGVLGQVDDPLKTSHLAPLMAGEKRSSFGFTEPDDATPTQGVIQDDELIINGQKSYVTGGATADFINTLVHIQDLGPSMVVVDTASSGLELEQKFSSLDGSHHAAFKYNNVRVPRTHIIGEPGKGLPRAMRQIGDTRLLFAATAVGYMLWTLNMLADHLKSADKSGSPRGDKDVVRWHYSELRIQAYAARSMLYRTARLADSEERVINETMACKAFATEGVGKIVDTAIQLVGGHALVEGHPLLDLYKKVRAWRLAEGASDILRLNIGRGILELDSGRI
ncbi:MAG: acyl-CoA dehydrogenase family protein [Pseudomonadota bacterium]